MRRLTSPHHASDDCTAVHVRPSPAHAGTADAQPKPATERIAASSNDHIKTTPPDQPPSDRKTKAKPIPALVLARIWVVRVFLMAWSRCFSLSGLYMLGQFFGTLEFLTDYNRRRRVDRKLRHFFKEEFSASWRRQVTWRYFMRIRCDKMFYTIMDQLPRSKVMRRIKLLGEENIINAQAKGSGVYVALCHFGSHHIAGLMMALLGYHIAGVRDPKESPVRRFVQRKFRETFPEVSKMRMFPATSFPRGIYRHLKCNNIVASLLDADRKRGRQTKTVPVTMFGEARDCLIGPLQIAIRCGATTLQGFVVSRKNFYYQLIVTPPLIDAAAVTDEVETIASVIQHYADGVEHFAREHPDHLMNI